MKGIYLTQTDQLPDETIDSYICRLRELAATCAYGAITDQIICDRLVPGTKGAFSCVRMLRDAALALDLRFLRHTNESTA